MVAPFSFPYGMGMFLDPVGEAEDVGKYRLGNGVRAVGRDVGHGDSLFQTKGEIDHVVTGCSDPDVSDGGKFRQGFPSYESLVGDDHLGPDASFLDQIGRSDRILSARRVRRDRPRKDPRG